MKQIQITQLLVSQAAILGWLFCPKNGKLYKNMFAKCPAGRPGTADEVANVAELLMRPQGAFITGADFLIDGGATASYFYGPLNPNAK